MTPDGTEDLVLVSDLHLGGYRERDDDHDRSFGEFLGAVGRDQAARGHAWRLVLLGDLFDFPAAAPYGRSARARDPARRAAALLDRVQECAPRSLDALRALLAAGGKIDVVAGNHDFELMHPAVQEVVAARLGGADDGGLAFYPWLYRVPGLLHAEHGSQHHDINRVGGLLARTEDLSRGRLRTPAAVLGRAQRLGVAGPVQAAVLRLAVPLVAAAFLVLASGADGDRARSAYSPRLAAYSGDVGLPAAVLAELDAVSRVSTVATARRILGRTLGRDGRNDMHEVMALRAADVHRVLSAHGLDTPFYVFGHTHVARSVELPPGVPAGRTARYLNTGTWSPLTRTAGRPAPAEGRPTWVHIDATTRQARLCRWGLTAP